MAMNRIQFQRGLLMAEFVNRYGCEAQCEAELETMRWPDGFRCPDCGHEGHSVFNRDGLKYWQCRACHSQTSLKSGTVFQATKLPLTRWFLAMHLLTQSKNNVSALELMRHLGVCYRTAWRLKHKLIQVMAEREAQRVLSGRVEIDDAYLGGEKSGTPGRGSENKVPFLIAVQTTEEGKPLYVRLDPLPFTREAIGAWAKKALDPTCRVLTDGLGGFRWLSEHIVCHNRIVLGAGRASAQHPEFSWVNTLLGNLTTAISGTYHAFKFWKYADRYLADFQYRFNRRFDLHTIFAKLAVAAVSTGHRTERVLRAC
jgi:transposase-like protein